ncbi:Partner of Y14 and mago [Pseudolycoriella hygida]|uniref:Partner of Y14 and mago n=1 Tax=Pseudolycoriella hygida TaxID=35572 RepID=A0A9Q0N7C4_9DIPT|nr:Partner of Y14 and mago [Pseudolycoriella hygida]
MTTYLRDSEGKFIPASQRPDGTWRKARRVKDGYVPQEEVPLYESKGKKFTKKPNIPVGMCPIMAEEERDKEKKNTKSEPKQGTSASASNDSSVMRLCDGVANVELSSPEDLQKQVKKLRKKIREIDLIEEKLKSGELKAPEQDQLDKVARKSEILSNIELLESKLKSLYSI